jgi:hypothetical protein
MKTARQVHSLLMDVARRQGWVEVEADLAVIEAAVAEMATWGGGVLVYQDQDRLVAERSDDVKAGCVTYCPPDLSGS